MEKRERRATIYDVAHESGVSITTVSRFLNNPSSVNTGTAETIAAVMERLDYIPQGNAGRRAQREVGRVGILTPFFPAPSFVQRLRGMVPVFKQHRHEMVVYTIESGEQLDEYVSSVPFIRRLDGIILMSVRLTPEQRRYLLDSGMETMMVDCEDTAFSSVVSDDYQGGMIAADLFVKKGYFPCAFIGDKNRDIAYSLHPSDVRFNGFLDQLKKSGQTVNEAYILETDTEVEDTEKCIGHFIDSGKPLRGIFAMSDLQAIGAVRAIRSRGLRVPGDVAVLGFDDIDASGWMEISTINQHLAESGRVAAGLLSERIAHRDEPHVVQKINLQVTLVERGTT